jgi:hypothetical protein
LKFTNIQQQQQQQQQHHSSNNNNNIKMKMFQTLFMAAAATADSNRSLVRMQASLKNKLSFPREDERRPFWSDEVDRKKNDRNELEGCWMSVRFQSNPPEFSFFNDP